MVRYTKEIFDILSKGGFISQNSISQQRTHLYDAIEDDFQKYQEYYQGIGFLLEGGNGYYYFSRTENKVELSEKVQRHYGLTVWIFSKHSIRRSAPDSLSASRTFWRSFQVT